jgi:hypothetical protein
LIAALTADPVAATDSCAGRWTPAWPDASGAAEPMFDAVYFPTRNGQLGRVTFVGLDPVRACRGEVGEGPDEWVFTIADSSWLAERHQ